MNEPETPELNKQRAILPQAHAVGDFFDWLEEQSIVLCQVSTEGLIWGEDCRPIGTLKLQLIANYFDIDLEKCDDERQAILDYIQFKS